jgi:type I restriction enzyme, R subunit
MVVSIDKATAVRTYMNVQAAWEARLKHSEERLASGKLTADERDLLVREIAFMRGTDMAVLSRSRTTRSPRWLSGRSTSSPSASGWWRRTWRADSRTRRTRSASRSSAMWTTGFDVPSCSTVYLDKPMRNQALMQTITRANRLFPGKNNGLIVGYVDILSNLNKALALYASTGALGQTVLPVDEKEALVDALRDALEEIRRFCQARDVDLDHITTLRQFEWVEALRDVSDQLMLSDEETSSFLERATRVERLFKAILPDDRADEFAPIRKVIRVVMDRIGEAGSRPEVSGVMAQIEQLLDESVAANAYLIGSEERKSLMDLSEVHWDAVKAMFKSGRQGTAAQKLRSMLTTRITNLTRLNPTRVDLLQRFQRPSTSTTPGASTSSSTSTSSSS